MRVIQLFLLSHWPYALLGDKAMLWFLVLLGYTYLTGCDPITPIADFSTGGLYSIGRGLASGDFSKATSGDLGAAGILESVGNQTIGAKNTQLARTGIGGGASIAGAAPGFLSGVGAGGAAADTAGAGISPGFTENVGSGISTYQEPGISSIRGPSGSFPTEGGIPVEDLIQKYGSGTGSAGATGTVGGFDVRSSPGPTPLTDLSPDAGGTLGAPKGMGSAADMTKALLALQAMQTARGLIPGQPTPVPDPNAVLADQQAQQQAEQQRAIQALIPERSAEAAGRGLSGASPEFLAGNVGTDPQTLQLVMQYLQSRGGNA